MARKDEVKLDEKGEDKVLTIKISLEGPSELMAVIREVSPSQIGERLSGLLPGDVRKHMRAARREQLLAARSFLDAMIEGLEREKKPSKRAVEVEVE